MGKYDAIKREINEAMLSQNQKEDIIIFDPAEEYGMLAQRLCGIITSKRGDNMTIKELCRSIGTESFEFRLGQFLDDFKHSDNRILLIKDEPEYVMDHDKEMCFIAGAVHKLCNDYKIEYPEWIFKREYYLDKRVYAFGSHDEDFHRYLRQTSPWEFSCRNYFVPDNTLQRV